MYESVTQSGQSTLPWVSHWVVREAESVGWEQFHLNIMQTYGVNLSPRERDAGLKNREDRKYCASFLLNLASFHISHCKMLLRRVKYKLPLFFLIYSMPSIL